MSKTCSVDGCDRKHASRGWCSRHYVAWWKHGDPLYSDPIHRIHRKYEIEPDTGCWLWTAYINPDGYGMFRLNGRMLLAHSAAYRLLVGDVPEGLEIDHLCHNRACVNPSHLEAVTHTINVRRMVKAHNATGVLGVTRHGSGYRAVLVREGKKVLCRTYRSLDEAGRAVAAARNAYERTS